jgi:peroxiredoxin
MIGFDARLAASPPRKESAMAIKVGDRLPDGTLTELVTEERPGCTVGPNAFNVAELTRGKKIVIFGLPGAFTPT